MLGTDHFTGETPEQILTHPGQAHFAIPGAKTRCGDCWFWSPRRPSDKKAICGKAASMMSRRGAPPSIPAVPRFATICQYFTKTAPEI
jgi:hypothetical protein